MAHFVVNKAVSRVSCEQRVVAETEKRYAQYGAQESLRASSIGETRGKIPLESYVIVEFAFPADVAVWRQSGSTDCVSMHLRKFGVSVLVSSIY